MDPPYYHNSPPSSFLDLNVEDHHDHHNHLFNRNPQTSSSLSLSSPAFMTPHQDHQGQFYYRESQKLHQVLPIQDQVDHQHQKIVSSGGSSCDHPRAAESESDHHNDLKLSIWRSSDDANNDRDKSHVSENNIDSAKWMPSKMRMMRKMIMNPDQTSTDHDDTPINFTHKFDQVLKKHPTSPFGADHSSSSSSNNNNNNTIRVCTDCNTTKTPLWRSGPRGPKSLCNACGIRQRKARRAMAAAAAAANGTIHSMEATSTKGTKVQSKEKKPKIGRNGVVPQFKKKCKLASPSRGRKKLGFEDLAISMSNNSAFQRVFPQDEKDAAILLMALSYGLVHG